LLNKCWIVKIKQLLHRSDKIQLLLHCSEQNLLKSAALSEETAFDFDKSRRCRLISGAFNLGPVEKQISICSAPVLL